MPCGRWWVHKQLAKVENNFRLVSIVEPDVEVLVTHFNIRLSGELCGRMRLIIPYLTLEPLREKFKALVTITQAATNTWTEIFATRPWKWKVRSPPVPD